MPRFNEHVAIRTGTKSVREAETKLKTIFHRLRLSKSDEHDILVASSEAVNNAAAHGNKNDRSKKITLDVAYDDSELTISIEDEGGGFNPDSLPDPLSPENLLKPSGRGILIMRSLMDKVNFEFTTHGTRTVLKKKIRIDGSKKKTARNAPERES